MLPRWVDYHLPPGTCQSGTLNAILADRGPDGPFRLVVCSAEGLRLVQWISGYCYRGGATER
jgi:hypothetical protein